MENPLLPTRVRRATALTNIKNSLGIGRAIVYESFDFIQTDLKGIRNTIRPLETCKRAEIATTTKKWSGSVIRRGDEDGKTGDAMFAIQPLFLSMAKHTHLLASETGKWKQKRNGKLINNSMNKKGQAQGH